MCSSGLQQISQKIGHVCITYGILFSYFLKREVLPVEFEEKTFIGIAANVMLFVQGLYGRPIFVFLLLVTVPLTWLLAHLASQKAASLAKDAPPQDQKS